MKARLAKHIPALDGLRGMAILLVMVFHFVIETPYVSRIDTTWHRWTDFGWTGVELFFVLSGFLITGILIDSKSDKHFFRNFYGRRFLRIFPLYYGFLTLLFVILPILGYYLVENAASVEKWCWTYLIDFFFAKHGWPARIVRHFWSLSVEEQFYFFWPLVVWLSPPKRVIKISLVLLLATIASRIYFADGTFASLVTMMSLCRLDGLFMGAIVASAIRIDGVRDRIHQLEASPNFSRVFYASLALVALFFLLGIREIGYTFHFLFWNGWERVILITFISLAFTILLYFTISGKRNVITRFFELRVLRFFGKYSYCMYVIHMGVAIYIGEHFASRIASTVFDKPLLHGITYILVMGSITTVLSLISWHTFEKHFLTLKKYFVSRKANAAELIPASTAEGVTYSLES